MERDLDELLQYLIPDSDLERKVEENAVISFYQSILSGSFIKKWQKRCIEAGVVFNIRYVMIGTNPDIRGHS